MIIPERNDEDTPPVYLSKLFDAVSKSVVASLLARNGDSFHQDVLTAYMRTFDFENDPMDMSLRKLLMEVELPSETQQIDRVLQAFAERYHDCNPFVYQNPDQAYFIAFSLIMLHTDYFNKNNKHKMQKADYIKNTTGSITKEGVSSDILECFYANIIYTPFIRMEDEYDINGEKIPPHRPKKSIFHRTINAYDGRRMKEPIDPYLLIIDDQLNLLRPNLKDVIPFEDPYSYSGTASRLNMAALHKAFFRSGVLQIVSARSRPDAFMNQATVDNPEGADPGVVEIKVTKVGILWRKDLKKKKARSPWQEWGAVLTGSQLYFFRNVSWVKNLVTQYEQHHKHGSGTPVIFKPALEIFKPDAQISTDDAVALLDKSYKKHKNAFAFIRHGGVQEYFIADSENEMNDWLAKLNYAATFRTAGVRMRGVFGGNYEGQRLRSLRRMDSVAGSSGSNSVQTPSGELAAEISAARREVVEQRIHDSEDRIAVANRELQAHLRNGRHLTILTPIQPRNREQVMMAAATLAAKLRWVRMEMWKLRCHRDILALDMEEERITMRDRDKRILAVNTPSPHTAAGVSPLHSAQNSPIVKAVSGGDATPTQANFISLSNDDISRISSHKSNISSEIPHDRIIDSTSPPLPRSPSMSSHGFKTEVSLVGTDDKSIETTQIYRSPTPTMSESSFAASIDQEEEEREREKDKSKEKTKGKEKDSSRPNIRKSLQRTLRESQGLGHKKNKPSYEDPMTPEKKALVEEGLARGSGSFTVHGKKASVITFGSEWQSMSSEDRLRRKKAQAGSEADTYGETESLSSILSFSRRGSTQAVQAFLKSEEGLQIPPQNLSRRGSHATVSTDELPEVPEGPIIDDNVIAKIGTYPGSFPHESSEEIRVASS
ncbi:hypothetical protein EDC01DRAFT_621152 [Geopyxis carbonaria]|nr:hypothetical protein EDC01DRAFT_621152 [Geopyxis carbonaria]